MSPSRFGRAESDSMKRFLAVPIFVAVLLWAYWTTCVQLLHQWSTEALYSHGYLVPLFSLFLLWSRRHELNEKLLRPSYGGLLLVLLGTILRLTGTYYSVYFPDRFSIPVILAGLCLGMGGWHALRWAWPALAFLFFMLPLPSVMEEWLTNPLQRVTTLVSTNILQTLGYLAEAEGNVIVLAEGDLGVVEACSGLRMLVVFCAVATGIALLSNRSLLQKLILLASALPIAITCNALRIVITAILYNEAGRDAAELVFHDLAGWLMIAMACGMLYLELWGLAHLLNPVPPAGREAMEMR